MISTASYKPYESSYISTPSKIVPIRPNLKVVETIERETATVEKSVITASNIFKVNHESQLFTSFSYMAMLNRLRCFNRIGEIAGLKENWDGYDASAIDSKVIQNSILFLQTILEKDYHIDSEDIVPTPYGNVVFDFNSSKGLVSVEVAAHMIGFFTDFIEGKNYSSAGVETDFKSLPPRLIQVLELNR